MMKKEVGEHKGEAVFEYTLENATGLKVSILSYGGIISSIMMPDRKGDLANVVLSYDSLEGYQGDEYCIGAMIGRVAGRLSAARYSYEGNEFLLDRNEGENHLHGGWNGLNQKVWSVKEVTEDSLTLEVPCEDGEGGYPGSVMIEVTYTLSDKDELTLSYSAIPDQDTPINLTNHSYFNLSGDPRLDVTDHELQLKSRRYLELDDEQLPTGTILPLSQGGFRFEGPISENRTDIDHPFLLEEHFSREISLHHPGSGRKVVIETDQPAVIVYTGGGLEGAQLAGGKASSHPGIALETQGYPDAPNHSDFQSVMVRAGEVYRAKTKYQFMVED
ncbi:galactose mutarotase [Rossellomorea marisflavi]|uniref:aldose epimerase family protein n=1 Tax=Rossellomorea marisflavi TaxID=189381 RepID=UPI00203C27E3|nr:aldose epimerase family protein [Rossellomorea marisflavi]MCM2591878.1 galactose mutarotase [Rossellomorea marisflavi]